MTINTMLMYCLYLVVFSTSCFGSTLQDGYELPSRLAVSAADCFLALTEALTKKAQIPSNRPKLLDSNAPKRPVTLVSSDSGKKKSKPASESIVASNMEMENILWDHLEELIRLVQKLLAVSSSQLHFGFNLSYVYFKMVAYGLVQECL